MIHFNGRQAIISVDNFQILINEFKIEKGNINTIFIKREKKRAICIKRMRWILMQLHQRVEYGQRSQKFI